MIRKIFTKEYKKRFRNWICQGKFYILSLLAIIYTTLQGLNIFTLYSNYISFFMIIIGLFLLLYLQIIDAREFSDYKPNTLGNWIKSFPTFRPITIAGLSAFSVFTTGTARVKVNLPESASLESKVDFLLQQMDKIEAIIADVDNRVNNVESSLTNEINDIKLVINKLENEIKSVIANHAVGAYDLNFLGIIITLCGTVIQSF